MAFLSIEPTLEKRKKERKKDGSRQATILSIVYCHDEVEEDKDRKVNDRMLAKSFLKEIKFL